MTNEEETTDKENLQYEILREDYPNYDLSFKVIIFGDAKVGKSCISIKFDENTFVNNYISTVGFEFHYFNIKIFNEAVIKLQIWDTCGQEVYRSLIESFYKNSSFAIIVFSIDK